MSGDPSFRFYKRSALVTSAVLTGLLVLVTATGEYSHGGMHSMAYIIATADGSHKRVFSASGASEPALLGDITTDIRFKSGWNGVTVVSTPVFTPSAPGTVLPPDVLEELAAAEIRETIARNADPERYPEFTQDEIASLTPGSHLFFRPWRLAMYIASMLVIGAIIYWLTFLRDRARWRSYRRQMLAKGQCPYCEYSLEGLTTDVCPKCGNSFAEPQISKGGNARTGTEGATWPERGAAFEVPHESASGTVCAFVSWGLLTRTVDHDGPRV